jgi:succinate dehydrogenase / fumarate reductase iron-sulfur subunit
MQATLKVRRYDPEGEEPVSRIQEYKVEVPDHATVLDALVKVREEMDPSLGMRCSCQAAICGSCSMDINRVPRLACKTKIRDMAPDGGAVTVDPMANQPVIRDLVVDQSVFWKKIRAVQPYLRPEGPVPEEEYIAPDSAMQQLTETMSCIMCGACVSACSSLDVDPNFLGPAALAKAFRFVADPRDNADMGRLKGLNEYGGVWDCTRCYLCVEVCPKGVDPMYRIMDLREEILKAGITNTPGARHVASFSKSVSRSGWLDETRLAVESWGIFNLPKLIAAAPVGIRALFRGKLPWPVPFHHKRPGAKNVGRIFQKLEGEK